MINIINTKQPRGQPLAMGSGAPISEEIRTGQMQPAGAQHLAQSIWRGEGKWN